MKQTIFGKAGFSVRIFRTSLVGLFLVLGLLCAEFTGSGAMPASAAPPALRVVSVELDRSGGFVGTSDHFVVPGDSPHVEAARLMQAAGSPRFLALRDAYLDNPCCDRFRYVVTVHYEGHVDKRVRAIEGAPGLPAVLSDVIDLTIEIGQAAAPNRR
ncbi:hypothetical protein HC031_02260 [Planosporangium thailandense]|uniref:Uncharacterized protein n=1 Tax=Planosporangium thailandense TaxID=765197 RepID=A0ABX0XRC4_9ACTN|nr:hypothetical protein [Planosporangium thailandense]NJC68552.1 hypothetical protein [Planosporangium thailandense]